MVNKEKKFIENAKKAVIQKLDQDGNGKLDICDVIIIAVKTPGVHIDRASFLHKELFKNHPEEIVEKAIAETPSEAGIPSEEIERIANEVIKFERNCVSGIAAALGMPGGWAMAAAIPADLAQYYGYTLRAAQKLLYLYGFPEISSSKDGLMLDTETMNTIILCLGVMNGVAGAHGAIMGMAKALANGVEKKLLQTALTKGAFYPFVKKIMTWFGVRLTKSIFAGFFKKAIPVVGGVVGGSLTFLSFKPCCERLKDTLKDTLLSNPQHVSTKEEEVIYESILSGEFDDKLLNETQNEISVEKENIVSAQE